MKAPKKPPLWIRQQVRKDLACDDCASVVKLGYRDDETLEATVDHSESCPKLPAKHRDAGETRFTTHPIHVQMLGITYGNEGN